MNKKRRVFLTGATGVMGMAAMKEFMGRLDRFDLIVLARPGKKNQKKLKPFIEKGVKVVWGDLMNPEDIKKGVDDADFVLHVGGMVSPAADYYPEKTYRVNTQSMRHIVEAVKARKDSDKVGVVYIGSVAQYGDHYVPNHWGRVGDVLFPAKKDAYASSKIDAERILSDSGLKKWVSLRQTAILSEALLSKATDPLAFHVPVRGVIEWVTAEDSGRLLANVCEDWVPDDFWCRFYNVGGGASYRLTNYEFEAMLMKALHCPPPEKVFDVRWFATQNFHGIWFEDSDRLDDLLHFRSGETATHYFKRLADSLPWFYRLTPLVPAFVIKGMMRWVAGRNHLAPLYWKRHDVKERIDLHFGGMDAWNSLPGWEGTDLKHPSDTPIQNSHGYDEAKPIGSLDIEDMRGVAQHRGGECLSTEMTPGDMLTLLEWKNAEGTCFKASPASVVLGGHWGPFISSW